MSETIDRRVVEMRFDNQQFESRTRTTLGTLEKLKNALNFSHAGDGLDKLGKSAGNINMNPLRSAVDGVQVSFSKMEAIALTALTNITNRAINAGIALAKSLTIEPVSQGFAEYELKMGSIQTIMASTDESLETVNGYLEELNTYADKTIYSFSDMTSNIGKFTNAGVKLEDAVKAIQGVSNEAAVSGANANEASRAMYNFAQALSAGYVKLIDWKSIENANMATVEFKDQLIETAVAMGTVVKEGDMYRSVTTDLNGKTSELFDTTHMFNDSLSSQWMTTDVLVQALNNYSTDVRTMSEEEKAAYEEKLRTIGYTEQQIQDIEELGKKAFDSAQDVKTFSQLMDTLKESVGSGWAQTFEIIFGNFEEAKSLWTSINDYIGDILQKQADARNDLLKEWKEWGGRDMLMRSFVNVWNALLKVLKPIKKAFQDVFPADMLAKLKRLTLDFEKFSKGLMVSSQTASHIRGTFQGLFSILGLGADVIREIASFIKDLLFPALGDGANGVLDFTNSLGRNIKAFREWINENGYIRKGLEAIQSLIVSGVARIKQWVASFKALPEVQAGIAKVQEKINDFIATIREQFPNAVKKFDELVTSFKSLWTTHDFSSITGPIKNFASALKTDLLAAWDKVKNSELFTKFVGMMRNIWANLKSLDFSKVSSWMKSFYDSIKKFFEPAIAQFDKIKEKLFGYSKEIGNGFTSIGDVLKNVGAYLKDHVGNIIAAFALFVGARVVVKFVRTIISIAKAVVSPIKTITDALSDFAGAARGIKKAANALAIVEVALAIALLANTAAKIGEVDLWTLAKGVTVIGVLGVLVAKIIKVMTGFTSAKASLSPKQIAAQSLSMLKIVELAGAVYLVAKAFQTVLDATEGKSWKQVAAVIGGLVVAVAALGGLSIAISRWGKTGGKGVAGPMVAIAASVYILSKCFRDILDAVSKDGVSESDIKWALITIGAMVGAMGVIAIALALVSKIKTTSNLAKTGGGILAVALGVKLLAEAVKVITELDFSTWDDGKTTTVVGIIAAIGAIMIALSKMPASAGMNGVGVLAVAAAVEILAVAIRTMGSLKPAEIAQGIIAIGLMIVFLAKFVQMTSEGSQLTGKTALVFLGLSAAILILSGAIALLGLLDAGSVIIGTAAIGALILAIGKMLELTGKSKDLKLSYFIGISAVVAVLAAAIVALSLLDPAGVVVATACLSALVGMMSLLLKVASSAQKALAPMLVMTLVVGVLGGVLYLLASNTDAGKAIEAALSISILMGVMTIVFAAAGSLTGPIAAAAVALGIMVGVISILGLVIAGIGAVITPGALKNMDTAIQFSYKVGEFIGSFVSGVASGLMSGAEDVAESLSNFADKVQPFVDSMKSLGSDSNVLAGVKTLTSAILEITGSNLLNSLSSFFGGGSLESFGESLATFGEAIAEFSSAISGKIDSGAVTAAALAGSALAALQNSLPKTGGLWSKIVGEEDMGKFSAGVSAFAQAIIDVNEVTSGITIDQAKIEQMVLAGQSLSKLQTAIPKTGSLWSKIVGEEDMVKFSMGVTAFGMAIASYSNSISGVAVDSAAIEASVSAGEALAGLESAIPKKGGWWQQIAGKQDISDFGDRIKTFGEKMIAYSQTVAGFTYSGDGATSGITRCARSLSSLANTVKENNSGSTLVDFGGDLTDFGSDVQTFYGYISQVDSSTLTTLSSALSNILSIASEMSSTSISVDFSGLTEFSEALSTAATTGISDFCSAFDTGRSEAIVAIMGFLTAANNVVSNSDDAFGKNGTAAAKAYSDAFGQETSSAKAAGTKIASSALSGLAQNIKDFRQKAVDAASAFVAGFSGYTSRAYSAGASLGSSATAGLRDSSGSARVYGNNFGSGFIQGLSGYGGQAYNAAYSLGRSAVNGLRTAINSHSPSKESQKSGDYFGIGFTSKILKWVSKAGEAATDLGEFTVKSLNQAIAKVPDMLSSGMNFDPVIRPVVDLSNAQRSVETLNDMFNQSVGVAANVASVTGSAVVASKGYFGDTAPVLASDGVNAEDTRPITIYNTFNITSDDPEEVANMVSRRIQKQVERKEAVWAQSSGTRSPLVRSPS